MEGGHLPQQVWEGDKHQEIRSTDIVNNSFKIKQPLLKPWDLMASDIGT